MSRFPVVGNAQIVGGRERQEDAAGVAQFRRLGNALALVLADGMGGHAGGDVAAGLAVRTVLAHLKTGASPPWMKLSSALTAANDGIRRAVQANAALEGMGCTLVAATISASRLRWISVGDSVLFLLRNGHLVRLNADHSMRSVLADMVARGKLSEEEAARDPTRNALRSAVTGDEIELIDAPDKDVALHDRDVVLVVSDGVETLTDGEIAEIASRAMARGGEAIVDALLKAVASRNVKHQDNASAIAYIHTTRRPANATPTVSMKELRATVTIFVVMALLLVGGGTWFYKNRAKYWSSADVPGSVDNKNGTHLPPGPIPNDKKLPVPASVLPADGTGHPAPLTPPAVPGALRPDADVAPGAVAHASKPTPKAATPAKPATSSEKAKPQAASGEKKRNASSGSIASHTSPQKPKFPDGEVKHAKVPH
jgi:serine/threonine protein phosphatase PrpC